MGACFSYVGSAISYINNRDQRLLEESVNDLKSTVATREDFEFECHATREQMAFRENRKMALFCIAMGKPIPEEHLGEMTQNQSMIKDIQNHRVSMQKAQGVVKVHHHLNLLKNKTKGMKRFIAKSNRSIRRADQTLDEKEGLDDQREETENETARIMERLAEGSSIGVKSLYTETSALTNPDEAREKLLKEFGILEEEDQEELDKESEELLKEAPSVSNEDGDDSRPTNQGQPMMNAQESGHRRSRSRSRSSMMSERNKEESEALLAS